MSVVGRSVFSRMYRVGFNMISGVDILICSGYFFGSLRRCSKAHWCWHIVGSCHMRLVSPWSFFCQWWKDGTSSWNFEYTVQFICEGGICHLLVASLYLYTILVLTYTSQFFRVKFTYQKKKFFRSKFPQTFGFFLRSEFFHLLNDISNVTHFVTILIHNLSLFFFYPKRKGRFSSHHW